MSLGDRELADADQSVHFAGVLVAEERGGLAEAHRQIAVAARAVEIDLILERAGHRTQRKALFFFIIGIAEDEHTVAVVIPVTGDAVEVALRHQRRFGQQIAALGFFVLDPALQDLNGLRALRQQDRQSLSDRIDRREVLQLAAELIVVAAQSLRLLFEIGVQLVLLREGDGIDALEHLAAAVSAPVSAAALRQLDRVALDASGEVQMRTCAKIREFALRVEGDHGVLGQIPDQLDLVRLVLLFHQADRFLAGKLRALDFEVFLADLLHLRLNGVEVFLREGGRRIEVVVETLFDRRTDGKLRLGVQALDRLRHHVRAAVPVGFAVFRIFKCILVFFGHRICLLL